MRHHLASNALVFSLLVAALGCGQQADKGPPAMGIPQKPSEHAHNHPEFGPHKGQLIELGKEEYHAELVHDDDAHTVTVYLLDGEAKKPVAIKAKELVLNLVVDGKPRQFTLAAQPEIDDLTGNCSCFSSKDEALCKALDAEGTKGRFNVEIAGKSFTGNVEHHHDH